jgi:hypothetical protein
MNSPDPRDRNVALELVLAAAEELLEARDNQMLTCEEWDALRHAVAEANEPPANQSDESFRIEGDVLVRRVVPAPTAGGKPRDPYEHTCEREVYEAVAHTIDEMGAASFTYEEVRQKVQAPFTQVSVAIAYLKERGLIIPTVKRRHIAASRCLYEDAMVVWHGLREMPDPDAQ